MPWVQRLNQYHPLHCFGMRYVVKLGLHTVGAFRVESDAEAFLLLLVTT